MFIPGEPVVISPGFKKSDHLRLSWRSQTWSGAETALPQFPQDALFDSRRVATYRWRMAGHVAAQAVMEHCGPSLMDCAPEISRMKAAGMRVMRGLGFGGGRCTAMREIA